MKPIESKSPTASLRSLLSKLTGIGSRPAQRGMRRSGSAERRHADLADSRLADCGGYNEAFVIQYWAGYNPRH